MGDINLNFQLPIAQRMLPTPLLNSPKLPLMPKGTELRQLLLGKLASGTQFPTAKVAGIALDTILDKTNLFGGLFGNIFSSGLSSAGDTIFNNIIKGTTLTEGLGLNVGSSVAGTLSGLGANLVGQGINKIGGDSMLSRGIGLGVATGLGTIGGTALSNLISTGKVAGTASKLFGTGNNILTTTKTVKDAAGNVKNVSQVGAINPYALGASIIGTGLSAAFGPSKEYGGDYGNVTKTMDAAYDAIQGAVGFIPGYGQAVAGLMALNKGLSNVFGSTSGNTLQDAILGSAFMPAPVKWLNMAGKSTSRSVHNLSWQNTEKRRSFMGNAFGNIEDRIQTGIDHSNSTQGLFAKHYTNKFNRQVDFANRANDMLLAMADLNELQNIRSLYMSSINNQRYAQMIQGGYNPLAIGKLGMKILNNATNHNMGLRLLSAAALIDNKAMILSAQGGTKIIRQRPTSLRRKPATREEDPELWDEWERKEAEQQAAKLRVYDLEQLAAAQRAETNTKHALHYSNLATGVAETAKQNALFKPVTQESLQNSNTEQLRLEQLADKNEYFDKGMDFIDAAGFADLGVNVAGPLLQRGFKWAFDKAGNLVKIQKDIPRKAENFYRAVNKDAIDDANKYGIIRGRQDREDNYAFFGRSSEPYHDTKYVIEGTPESADWISTYKYAYNKNPEIVYLPKIPDRDYSKAYHTIIGSPEPNGFLKIGVYDSEFLEGYEALPSIKGQLNISPSSNFTYWKKYPIIGWRLHLFKNKVPIQKINLFLTSPYTGKWTLFGNREYRFKPGYAAMNGAPIESRVYNSKLMDTINKFWENIGKNKVRVQGEKTSGILTKPGTAPETFNGQNIQYISSPNGLPVVNKFYTEQGSEYILTKDGFARRIKSPHSNTGGSDSGLHDWNTGHTVFTEGKEGELFNMATLFLHERGKKIAIGNSNGKLQLWIIGENGQWRPALKSDAYPQAVKLGIMLDGELISSYSKEPVIGNHILEYDMNSSGIITGSHPGSPVSFIE